MRAILQEEAAWVFKLLAALFVSLFVVGFLALWVKLAIVVVKAIWSLA